MERFAGAVLVVIMAAVLLGVMLTDQKARFMAVAAACALFILYAVFSAELVVVQGLYLFAAFFFMPFSIGAWLQRRINKRRGR